MVKLAEIDRGRRLGLGMHALIEPCLKGATRACTEKRALHHGWASCVGALQQEMCARRPRAKALCARTCSWGRGLCRVRMYALLPVAQGVPEWQRAGELLLETL